MFPLEVTERRFLLWFSITGNEIYFKNTSHSILDDSSLFCVFTSARTAAMPDTTVLFKLVSLNYQFRLPVHSFPNEESKWVKVADTDFVRHYM